MGIYFKVKLGMGPMEPVRTVVAGTSTIFYFYIKIIVLGKIDDKGFDKGLHSYYFIRPHLKLDGNPPSDSVGLSVGRNNRWLSLIMRSSNRKEG